MICRNGTEIIEHFLLKCKGLQQIRKKMKELQKLQNDYCRISTISDKQDTEINKTKTLAKKKKKIRKSYIE